MISEGPRGSVEQEAGYPQYHDELNLRELFQFLWKKKLLIAAATGVTVFLSLILALVLPDIYRSEGLLAAEEEAGAGSLAGLASQYGGLASLAGISLPLSGSNLKQVGLETLKSRKFLSDFVDRHDILPELMAVKSFDWETKSLSYNTRLYDPDANVWVRKFKPPQQARPSYLEAYEEFSEILGVSENVETGFVTVSIEHVSPYIAESWVRLLIEDLNQQMMLDDVEEAQQSIDYLNEQLEITSVLALKEVFYSLIEEQTKTIMLANARPEYLFKTIDPPVVEEERAKPNRILILVFGAMLGFFIGCSIALFENYVWGPDSQ